MNSQTTKVKEFMHALISIIFNRQNSLVLDQGYFAYFFNHLSKEQNFFENRLKCSRK